LWDGYRISVIRYQESKIVDQRPGDERIARVWRLCGIGMIGLHDSCSGELVDIVKAAASRRTPKGREMWEGVKGIFRTRYVVMLEEEVARLRGENRALLNSLLGTAGFAPIETGEAGKPAAIARMRRRSWPQVQAMRESEAGRG
jgi:hypothetical protein